VDRQPSRIQQRRTKDWRKPPGAVSVARRRRDRFGYPGFGNPFPVEVPGDPASHAAAVMAFLEWVTAPGQADLLARACRELAGRDLMCWCAPDLPCHADVWLELVNDQDDD
jgi:hypothetical protein